MFVVIGFGGFDETVEAGAGVGAVGGRGKEPVFAAKGEGANGVFD